MQFSPSDSRFHRKLYRNRLFAVTLAASFLLASPWLEAQGTITQYGRRAVDKGPRALALVQLLPNGKKGRLIPIAIMMDGKFYDAGSYKAAPVPMALDFDTVYEGFHTGVSQGVFTITQPGQLNHVWIAEGTWLPAGMKAPEKSKKYSTPVIEDKDAPPVLHRHSEKSDSDSTADNKDKNKDKSDRASDDKNKDDKSKDQPKPAASASPEPVKAASAPPPDEPIADPNRPRLRRGKPDSNARREPFTTFDALPDSATPGTGTPDAKVSKDDTSTPQITFIPAISDAGGPDPRPYVYDMKSAEEAGYRRKMEELAVAQLRAQTGAGTKEPAASVRKKSAKPVPLALDYVSLHVFDLSSSNEPVLVLSAKTHPAAPAANGTSEVPKEITLIARTNLEGELKKLFFSQTDAGHLDVTPRLELIDAVDADGDGRGELLFRRTFDNGSVYAIYRVTPDGLWPLFEVTP